MVANSPRQSEATEGQVITAMLPGEFTRVQVEKVMEDGSIVAKICNQPMAKSHSYQLGQSLRFQRVENISGQRWELVL